MFLNNIYFSISFNFKIRIIANSRIFLLSFLLLKVISAGMLSLSRITALKVESRLLFPA